MHPEFWVYLSVLQPSHRVDPVLQVADTPLGEQGDHTYHP